MLLLHLSSRSINHYTAVKQEKPTSWRPTPSNQQPIFATEAVSNRALFETASVDGCQTVFSVNRNAVHTRHISVDGDR